MGQDWYREQDLYSFVCKLFNCFVFVWGGLSTFCFRVSAFIICCAWEFHFIVIIHSCILTSYETAKKNTKTALPRNFDASQPEQMSWLKLEHRQNTQLRYSCSFSKIKANATISYCSVLKSHLNGVLLPCWSRGPYSIVHTWSVALPVAVVLNSPERESGRHVAGAGRGVPCQTGARRTEMFGGDPEMKMMKGLQDTPRSEQNQWVTAAYKHPNEGERGEMLTAESSAYQRKVWLIGCLMFNSNAFGLREQIYAVGVINILQQ